GSATPANEPAVAGGPRRPEGLTPDPGAGRSADRRRPPRRPSVVGAGRRWQSGGVQESFRSRFPRVLLPYSLKASCVVTMVTLSPDLVATSRGTLATGCPCDSKLVETVTMQHVSAPSGVAIILGRSTATIRDFRIKGPVR